MKLEHTFTVPVPVDTVWRALLDPARVAPCFPGATITLASGDEFAGTVQIRLGPISLRYQGSGRFTETDESAYRTVIVASGTSSGGQSTAGATVVTTLGEHEAGTTVQLATELSISGKPVQFGQGLFESVGKKVLVQFAESLAEVLTPGEEPTSSDPESVPPDPMVAAHVAPDPVVAAPVVADLAAPDPVAPSSPAPPTVAPGDEIDLLDAAGGTVTKPVVAIVGGLVVLLVIACWLRRR